MFKQNFLLKVIHEIKYQFISGVSVLVEQSLLDGKKKRNTVSRSKATSSHGSVTSTPNLVPTK